MNTTITELLHEKEILISRLNKMVYGSVEIRNSNEKKYIYVHYRLDGKRQTKYVGEYSEELHSLILENNNLAKQYKKRVRVINKELGALEFESFELTDDVKLNLDFARRNMVDSIYKQSILEGIVTTYSDTETIVNGGIVKGMTTKDISKVVNLKRAWEFIMSEGVITYPTNYAILCQINAIVEDGFSYSAGKIRSIPVSIGGSTYMPPIPLEIKVKDEINRIINSSDDVIETTIKILLYVMKTQIFLDGNKRTAVIFANHYLISRGKGLIVIPVELVSEYKKMLIDYYEDKNDDIKNFLKEKCYNPLGN
ncbi:MAG TPA: Fic family protein [Bacilli bacterium]|jgi:Fic family protein|nr:Fic family protein [Bacilli bacterium]HQB96195.1 Fic family protein [Bacilli bacterium]